MSEVRMTFHYDGGTAANEQLEIYDASVSLSKTAVRVRFLGSSKAP